MNIQEAVKKALGENKYISDDGITKIQLNIGKPCIIMLMDGSNACLIGWNPTADDLLTDDWKVVN